jgi:hypothetical protein
MGEGANEKIIASMDEPPPVGSDEPEAEPDGRYDNRYDRTYDSEKRLVTETVFDNTGTAIMSKAFTYGPTRRDVILRMGDGSFSNKTIQIFNPDKQLVEERSCDEHERKCNVKVLKYEVDSRGNWVIKRDFEKKVVKGKVSLKPTGTFYRKIEYATP